MPQKCRPEADSKLLSATQLVWHIMLCHAQAMLLMNWGQLNPDWLEW